LIEPPFDAGVDIQVVTVDTFLFLTTKKRLAGQDFGFGRHWSLLDPVAACRRWHGTTLTGEACPVGALVGTLESSCNVYETSFQIIVEGILDSAFELSAYTFIKEEMNSGAFVEAIPLLDRVEYLRPVLDLLPIETPEIPNIDRREVLYRVALGGAVLAM
jgi:hypothetical protein